MDDQPKFSLQKEIKKRKTQELARQASIKRGTGPLSKPQTGPLKPVDPPAEKKRTTQTAAVVPPDARRASQTISAAKRTTEMLAVATGKLTRRQQRNLIVAIAAILSMIVCVGTLSIASSVGNSPTPTPQPLPQVSANDVVNYLKKVGVGIADFQSFGGASSPWDAYQQLQFTAKIGDDKTTIILLSYGSLEGKVPDIFKTAKDAKFKTWQMVTAANIIMLMAPETSSGLKTAMTSHLTAYMIAPYRDFLPTATPTA